MTGDPVFSGYYENPEQNARSFTGDGWFRSGDLAVIEDGILTVTGRVDDLITLNGAEYHGHEIEALVEELPFVEPSFTIVSPCTAAGGEEELVVFYHPRGGTGTDEADRRIRDLVTERYGVRLGGVVTLAREDVPKTGIGKLRRAELRKRHEAGTAADRAPGPDTPPRHAPSGPWSGQPGRPRAARVFMEREWTIDGGPEEGFAFEP
ncbi:hypothetical protein ACFQ1I_23170 [Kitasatospora arboriphila]